jgi:hypothetical protein
MRTRSSSWQVSRGDISASCLPLIRLSILTFLSRVGASSVVCCPAGVPLPPVLLAAIRCFFLRGTALKAACAAPASTPEVATGAKVDDSDEEDAEVGVAVSSTGARRPAVEDEEADEADEEEGDDDNGEGNADAPTGAQLHHAVRAFLAVFFESQLSTLDLVESAPLPAAAGSSTRRTAASSASPADGQVFVAADELRAQWRTGQQAIARTIMQSLQDR